MRLWPKRILPILTVLIAAQAVLLVAPLAGADPGTDRPRYWYDLSPIERQAIEADMRAIPQPPVEPIGTSPSVLNPFNYRRLIGQEDVIVYDAPGGSPVSTVPAGFNFVSVNNEVDGWTEINYGEWVSSEYISRAVISEFHGVLLPEEGLRYPMGWVLLDTEPSPRPGVPAPDDTPLLDRYTPITIFAVQRLGEWDWFLIGPDRWIEQRRVGKLIPVARPEGVAEDDRWFGVDLYEQVLVAYEGDRPVFATLVSSGLPQWDTDPGLFQIDVSHRFVSTPMIGALGEPDSYIIEDIPWTLFFNMDSEEALHGTYWHDGFGYRHSHGCVNMTITDSRWIFDWTSEADYQDAWVYVYYSQQYNA